MFRENVGPRSDEATVRELEDRRFNAVVAGDFQDFAACCHPDLTYIHSNAAVDTLETYMQKCLAGHYRYHSIEHPIDKVSIWGDIALVFGEMRADLTVGGVRKQLDNVALAVWVRTAGGWKLLAYQPTAKPPVG